MFAYLVLFEVRCAAMQDTSPTEAEVAQDPRLERVIGAILSGAGKAACC